MAKKKKDEAPSEDTASATGKIIEITGAMVSDDICDYAYNALQGPYTGEGHKVKGNDRIVDEDLKLALGMLDVHLAAIDGAFLLSGVEVQNINKFHTHKLTKEYHVRGFSIHGAEENKSVVLQGTKSCEYSGGDLQDIKTTKISLGDGSAYYPFRKELTKAIDNLIVEVELYREGKYTKQNQDTQISMEFESAGEMNMEDAKVQ